MADGSISRMSASRSRTISKMALRSSGPCSTWVSAGTDGLLFLGGAPVSVAPPFSAVLRSACGDRGPQLLDDLLDHHLPRHLDGVQDRLRARRAVADDADAVDAEEHRPAEALRLQALVEVLERRADRLEVRGQLVRGRERPL